MKKVPQIDHNKNLRLLKRIRKWAKKMGAPEDVLQDLSQLEEKKEDLNRAFSGNMGEALKHMTKYVKPLEEADKINKTAFIYKANLLYNQIESNSLDDTVKALPYIQDYLLIKEKIDKIIELRIKKGELQANVDRIKRAIEREECSHEKVLKDTTDTEKKIALLELTSKRTDKQVAEWTETTNTLKRIRFDPTASKTSDKAAQEALVKDWVERCVDIAKKSMDPDEYEKGEDTETMFNNLTKDLTVPRYEVPSKRIVSTLKKIVAECNESVKKLVEEDLPDQDMIEFRRSCGEREVDAYTKLLEYTIEANKMRVEVVGLERELFELKRDIVEYLNRQLFWADPTEVKDLPSQCVENFIEAHVDLMLLPKMNSFVKENIFKLRRETTMEELKNELFEIFLKNRHINERFAQSLHRYFRKEHTRIKASMDKQYRGSVAACKQPEYVNLKGLTFEEVKDFLEDEIEIFLSTPMKVIESACGAEEELLRNDLRMNLYRRSELFSGPNHMILKNLMDAFYMNQKWMNLPLPTAETNILSIDDSSIEDIKQKKDETEKALTDKANYVSETLSETTEKTEKAEIVLNDWMELPFYDCIPESLELDGKTFAEWRASV